MTPTPSRTNLTTRFDAGNTTLGEKSIVEYTWSFGDGRTAISDDPVVTHIYDRPGVYRVTVTARGPNGTMTTVSRNVTVRPPEVAAPGSSIWWRVRPARSPRWQV